MSCYFCTGCGKLFEYAKHDRLQKISYCNPTGKPQAMMKAQLTPWFNANTPPVRGGWYEIKNIACQRAHWSGKKFMRNGQPLRYPSKIKWRGLMPRDTK